MYFTRGKKRKDEKESMLVPDWDRFSRPRTCGGYLSCSNDYDYDYDYDYDSCRELELKPAFIYIPVYINQGLHQISRLGWRRLPCPFFVITYKLQ